MRGIDTMKAYALLDVLGGFLGDIRSTLQDLDPTDADNVAYVRHDVMSWIGNCAAKLHELRDAVGGQTPLERHGNT